MSIGNGHTVECLHLSDLYFTRFSLICAIMFFVCFYFDLYISIRYAVNLARSSLI